MCFLELTSNLTTSGMSPSIKGFTGFDYFTRSPLLAIKTQMLCITVSRDVALRHPSKSYNLNTGLNAIPPAAGDGQAGKRRAMLLSPVSMFSFNSELYSCLPQLSRSSIS